MLDTSAEDKDKDEAEDEAILSSSLFYVLVGVLAGVLIIVVVITVVCYLLICNRPARRDHVRHSRSDRYRVAQKTGGHRPSYLIANIPKTP